MKKLFRMRRICVLALMLLLAAAMAAPAYAAAEDQMEPAAQEDTLSLVSAVRALPDKYSAVIHLYYYEGYSIKEIAKTLGLPAATVGTRLARGRERLRQMLKEDVV